MDSLPSHINITRILKSNDINELSENLKQEPTLFVALSVSVLCGMISFLLLLLWKRSSRGTKDTILIMGPAGSGKTCLFSKLTCKGWKGTVTSTVPNVGQAKVGTLSEKTMQIVDLPGSSCLAYFAQRYLKQAAMIIFVVDGVDFLNQINDTAEMMWKLLEDPIFKKTPVPVLVLVNKSDMGAKCHTDRFVISRLQREVDGIKKQQSQAAEEQESFTFDKLKPEVAVSKISAKLDELAPLQEFINKHVK